MAANPAIAVEASELPPSWSGLEYPDYPMSGEEQERFQHEFDQYIGRSGARVTANEFQMVYLACRAGWWMRHLDHIRRGREAGAERGGARALLELEAR